MRQVEPNVRYPANQERLFVSKYHCSFVLPTGYDGLSADLGWMAVASDTKAPKATLYLSGADNLVVRGWVDEAFTEQRSVLNPEGVEQFAGTRLRRFRSATHVGYKARVEDVFLNRVALVASGPSAAQPEVHRVARSLLASIEFHDDRPLEEARFVDAATGYLNAPFAKGADVFLYLARHSHLLSPRAVSAFGALVRQMRAERHPNADFAVQRLEFISKAKEALDAGEWQGVLDELRAT